MIFPKRKLSSAVTVAALSLSFSVSQAFAQQLEEVVVTAQKREQNMQDVGISVNAFTGKDLNEYRMSKPADLAAQTPNMDIKNPLTIGNPVVTIRGVGLNDFNANNNPTAGVYVDEIYLTSTAMMSFQLFDLERVEVLKGPQGTLYGRNSTAGAINFVTKRPTDEFEAYVTGTAGNYKLGELEGAVSGPISDSVRYRVSAKTTQQKEGIYTMREFNNDDHGEVDVATGRAQLDWDINENATLELSVHGDKDKSDAGLFEQFGMVDLNTGAACAPIAAGRLEKNANCTDNFGYNDLDGDPYKGDWNMQPIIDRKAYGGRAALNWDIGDVTLTSITGYEYMDRYAEEGDEDAGPLTQLHIFFDDEIKQFSQEFRAAGSKDRLDWVAGVFYSSDEVNNFNIYEVIDLLGVDELHAQYEQETKAAALFANTEWNFTDRLRLIAGLRYTKEEKEFVAESIEPAGLFGPTPGTPLLLASTDEKIDDTNWSGKLGVEFDPNEDIMLYASVSNGFKSGGFFGGIVFDSAEYASFEPEELRAFELGFKSRLFDNTLQLNAAYFYYDYQDVQAFIQVEDPGQLVPLLKLENIPGSSEVQGIDMDVWWRPVAGLDLKAGLGFVDTELADFVTGDGAVNSGNKMANTPELTWNASARYEWDVSSSMMMSAMIAANYTDEMFKDTTNNPLFRSDEYTLVDARLALGSSEGQWEVAAWGKNLTDEIYIQEAFGSQDFGWTSVIRNMPRTYGVSLTYNWM